MGALTQAKQTRSRESRPMIPWPVEAGATIYAGALVMLSDGYATQASPDSGTDSFVLGVAADSVSGGGVDGLNTVRLRQGDFYFPQTGFAQADCGQVVYALTDQDLEDDVGNAGTNPVIAGQLLSIESGGAWVRIEMAANLALLAGVSGSGTATGDTFTATAGEDLTAAQYHPVKIQNIAGTTKVFAIGSDGDVCHGILLNAPDVDESATVQFRGKLSSALTVNDIDGGHLLWATADGYFDGGAAPPAGYYVFGFAIGTKTSSATEGAVQIAITHQGTDADTGGGG